MWCNVSPLRGEKPQNRPLSNLNTDALRCVAVRDLSSKLDTRCSQPMASRRLGLA